MKTLYEEFKIVNQIYFDNSKDGVVLTYFPYLNDSELEILSNWIFNDVVDWRSLPYKTLGTTYTWGPYLKRWYHSTYERDIIINTYLRDTQISYPHMPQDWEEKLSYRDRAQFTKSFQQAMLQWRATLPRSERSLVDKLIRNGFDVFEPKNLLLLSLLLTSRGPAVGLANKNQVCFSAMYKE